MRRAALILFAAALVVFAVLVAAFLRTKHDFPAQIPSPPSPNQVAILDVPAHQQACMGGVAIEQHSEQLRFMAGTYGKAGPPLSVSITGSGYRTFAAIAGGYQDNAPQALPIRVPRRAQLVTVCIANDGRTKIGLYGASDRARSRAVVTVGGKPLPGTTPELAFYEARPASLAGRLAVTAQRIAVFRGFLGHTWIVWAIAVLFLIGVPLLLLGGLAEALREE